MSTVKTDKKQNSLSWCISNLPDGIEEWLCEFDWAICEHGLNVLAYIWITHKHTTNVKCASPKAKWITDYFDELSLNISNNNRINVSNHDDAMTKTTNDYNRTCANDQSSQNDQPTVNRTQAFLTKHCAFNLILLKCRTDRSNEKITFSVLCFGKFQCDSALCRTHTYNRCFCLSRDSHFIADVMLLICMHKQCQSISLTRSQFVQPHLILFM